MAPVMVSGTERAGHHHRPRVWAPGRPAQLHPRAPSERKQRAGPRRDASPYVGRRGDQHRRLRERHAVETSKPQCCHACRCREMPTPIAVRPTPTPVRQGQTGPTGNGRQPRRRGESAPLGVPECARRSSGWLRRRHLGPPRRLASAPRCEDHRPLRRGESAPPDAQGWSRAAPIQITSERASQSGARWRRPCGPEETAVAKTDARHLASAPRSGFGAFLGVSRSS